MGVSEAFVSMRRWRSSGCAKPGRRREDLFGSVKREVLVGWLHPHPCGQTEGPGFVSSTKCGQRGKGWCKMHGENTLGHASDILYPAQGTSPPYGQRGSLSIFSEPTVRTYYHLIGPAGTPSSNGEIKNILSAIEAALGNKTLGPHGNRCLRLERCCS